MIPRHSTPDLVKDPVSILPLAFLGLIAATIFFRLRFGLDFTDEAYYAVLAQRFALGDIPYVDEINLRQSAALFTAPFYWCYLRLNGSTDGIVYFLRCIFFGLQCVVAATAFRFTYVSAPRQPVLHASIAATWVFLFIPHSIPACSYNTLGSLLFALGTIISLDGILNSGSRLKFPLAGAVHGLAVVAYPALLIPVVIHGAVMAAFTFPKPATGSARTALSYGAGVGLIVAAFLICFHSGMMLGIRRAMEFEGMFTRQRDAGKLGIMIVDMIGQAGPLFPAAIVGLLAFALRRRMDRLTGIALLFLAVPAWFWSARRSLHLYTAQHDLGMDIFIYLGILSGLLFPILTTLRESRCIFLGAWLPSMLAGMTTAMASDGGWRSAGLGIFTAVLATPLLISHARAAGGRTGNAAMTIAMILISLALVRVHVRATYFDGPWMMQTTEVTEGPYKGLRGAPVKAAFAESATREVRHFWRPGERMLVYYNRPGVYLSVPARPSVEVSWTDHRARMAPLLPYFDDHRTGQGIVVVMKGERGTSRELEMLVEDPDRLLVDAPEFRIYREPSPSPAGVLPPDS